MEETFRKSGCSVCSLKIRGEHIDKYITENQDRARNAHLKSLTAAFAAWTEDLKHDQTKFEAERILHLDGSMPSETLGIQFNVHPRP